jgi:hypothetical protein
MLLEEFDLLCFVEGKVTISIDPMQLVEHNEKVTKAKGINIDYVKGHLIPHIGDKKSENICTIP